MKTKLLFLFLTVFALHSNAQVISMIGSTSPSGSWSVDTNMNTTDNITYTLNNVTVTTATDPNTTGIKFRQDAQWTTNWGNANFPSGTGTQNGPNILSIAGTYNVTFNRVTGAYSFVNTLSNPSNTISNLRIYPNPTNNNWNITLSTSIDSIQLFDVNGKEIQSLAPMETEFQLDGNGLSAGIYFVKITSGLDFTVQKIIKN